jgi:predicted ATPase/DNA-binding CsgD family transcriptional regulator
LVGRARQRAELTALLRDPQVRLLTLIGPGGVGKTRLALAAAELADPEYTDGTLFVPLAAVVDPGLVLPSIAAILDVKDGEGPVELRVALVLANRQILLVLDNFEQVAPAGTAIGTLLKSTAGVTALVTSRAPLRIAGERVYSVPPLDVPDSAREPTAAVILNSGAGALFVERAQAGWPAFTLTVDNAPAIGEICRRLDGLPLALELAAARVNVLTPQELLVRLNNQLQVLTAGPQVNSDRQRTMRETIAWSYGLLAPEHQALFRWLAVFRGGFSLDVVEHILANEPEMVPSENRDGVQERPAAPLPDIQFDILDGISVLADQSLIDRDDRYEVESRFRMLEPIREFGLEQLVAYGEEPAIFARFAAYWQTQAEASRPALVSFDLFKQTLDQLEQEHDNLRAALDWLELHDMSAALNLAGALWWFWFVRGYQAEGLHRLDHLIDAAPETTSPRSLARAQLGAAPLAHYKNQPEKAVRLAQDSLTTWRELGDAWGIGFAQYLLGVFAEDDGEYERARCLLYDALACLEPGWDHGTVNRLRYHLAVVAFGLDDLEESHAILSSLLGESGGLPIRVMPWAIHLRGLVAHARREPSAALGDLQESLRQFLNAHASSEISQGLAGVAVAASTWDPATATRLLAAAHRLNEERGERFWLPERAVYEAAAERVRVQLGDERFAEEYGIGRNLPVEQAIEIALGLAVPAPRKVRSGKKPLPCGLSDREAEVLRLLAAGWPNERIANALFLSPRTVQTHLTNIYRKLGVSNRSEAVRFAIEHGLS